MKKELVIVLDFGGQYNQLVARRVRECNVYCEIYSYKTDLEKIKAMNPKGIILTGGPNSCYEADSPTYSKELFENTPAKIQISEDYFNQVSDNEYCFIENQIVDILKAKKVVVYRWDKVYPADYKLPLRQYKLVSTLEFQGYSHDKIVKEVYERNETIKK